MKKIFFILLLFPLLNVQGNNIDSLWNVWHNNTLHDTVRLQSIQKISWDIYLRINPDSSYYFAQKQYDFAEEKNEKVFMAKALKTQGISFFYKGEYDNALTYSIKCLNLRKEIGDQLEVAKALKNIGIIYKQKGDFNNLIYYLNENLKVRGKIGDQKEISTASLQLGQVYRDHADHENAIYYYSKSLKISEEINDSSGIARSLGNIGNIYYEQEDFINASSYYSKSLNINEKIENRRGISTNLNNLGATYRSLNQYEKSLYYYSKSLEIFKEINDKIAIASSLNNIGLLHQNMKNFDDAIEKFHESLAHSNEIDDKKVIATTLNNIGMTFNKKGLYKKGLYYSSKALEMSTELDFPLEIRNSAQTLWEINKALGNYNESLKMYELFINTRDSILSEENQRALIQQEYKYAYEKQATADSIKAIEEHKVKDALITAEKAENKQQKQRSYFLFGFLALALIFGGFIFNRFRATKIQKNIIETQKNQVDNALTELGIRNKEIVDSINYAKRIQSAILPPTKLVKNHLPNSFIFYKPKDIVAGDFYWMEPQENRVLFAAADCTGHGVPGALVSVVCNNGLNRAVREYGLTVPGEILDKTREIVIKEFEKSEEEVRDGMDIALCSLEGNTLKYAGAHNPLWIIRNNQSEIEEIKANKQPIGKFGKSIPYTTHTIELNTGDTIYLFSDGYADQFGGPKGKKFMSANFKKFLISIKNETIQKQKELISQNFDTWRGNLDQLDDVCVIGIKI